MGITVRDLENFVAVAGARTLSEASEKLGMAQPSLSLGIKKLETELGIPLFVRGRDGIKITPQGRNVLPQAEQVVQLVQMIQGLRKNFHFKLGCHASVGMYLLGNFLKDMHVELPDGSFDVVNGSSHEINKLVARGELDFGAVINPLPIAGLVTKYIGEDEVQVWESKGRYSDKLIYNSHMIQANSIVSRWKGAPSETIDVDNLELIASLVHSGAGYGILPRQVVKAQRWDLKVVPNTPSFKDKIAVVCYPEMLRSKDGDKIFQALKRSFRS